MESTKVEAVAGEGKAVTSERSSFGISCGAPESVEAVTAKSVAGEQTGRAHGGPEHDAQYGCMPVVSKAGNRGAGTGPRMSNKTATARGDHDERGKIIGVGDCGKLARERTQSRDQSPS